MAVGRSPFVVVLGTAQDAGIPQAGCGCSACVAARECRGLQRRPSCLGIVDSETGGRWIIDATPVFPQQLHDLNVAASTGRVGPPDGIFLTHAHVGHYAGLINLGHEVMDSRRVPLWVMPAMKQFLRDNQPWASLIRRENVVLRELAPGRAVSLGNSVRVVAIPVPHRDEYSETVAFGIEGPTSRVLWLPDIDAWD
ncbi:MAG: MBL fold metallo-hydrolase, partial [Planctomycetaceae bacterium]